MACARGRGLRRNRRFVARKYPHDGPTIRFVDTRIRFWQMDFRRN
jgi:hypothetical protein